MTIAMRHSGLPDALSTALFDLLKCGFGHVDCDVRDDTALDYQEVELTYRPEPGEGAERFIGRLLADPPWRPGDRVSIIAKRKQLDLIRIRRFTPHASDIIVREPDEDLAVFAARLERIA